MRRRDCSALLLLSAALPAGALIQCARPPLVSTARAATPFHRVVLPRMCTPDDRDAAAADDEDSWLIDRARLSEQWSKSIRTRKPRFLPFRDARQWARAMFMTEEADWRQWIDDGEKRNPYIPSFPDEVYADEGWEGWDDFLNGPIEELSDILRPGYKRGKFLRGPGRQQEADPEDS